MIKYMLLVASAFSSLATGSELACNHPTSTVQINECAAQKLKAAETKMHKYLNKSVKRYSDDSTVVKSIIVAQKAWSAYQETHCNSVYDVWREGTMQTAMVLSCKITLTHQRTHELWAQYLSHMVGKKPILPEPRMACVK